MRAATVASSFRYAFAGLRYLLWTQRNAKIHTAIGLAAVALGFVLGIDRNEWLTLTLMITIVLAAEGINTAIEAAVDLASPTYHPLAKIAKDVGAGTVLLTAVASVLVRVRDWKCEGKESWRECRVWPSMELGAADGSSLEMRRSVGSLSVMLRREGEGEGGWVVRRGRVAR